MRKVFPVVSLLLFSFLCCIVFSAAPDNRSRAQSIEERFNISGDTPSLELIELKNAEGMTLQEILASGPVLSYRLFPTLSGEELDRIYLCVAFGDSRFLAPPRIVSRTVDGLTLSNTVHEFSRGIVIFYECDNDRAIWKGEKLIPRYMFVCSDRFLGFETFILQKLESHLFLMVDTPSGNLIHFLLRKRKDGALEPVWFGGSKGELEIADIDNDLSKEFISTNGFMVELFRGDIQPGLEASIYKSVNGKYELVEIVPYDSRLAPRKLPDTPLPEDDFQ